MKKLWAFLTIISAAGGLYFLYLSAKYGFSYFSSPLNPHRMESIQGAILSLILATPFWFAASAFTYPLRKTISKRLFIALNTPSLLLVIVMVLLTILPVIMYTLEGYLKT